MLKNLDVDLGKIRGAAESLIPRGTNKTAEGKLPIAPGAKKAVECSFAEARNLDHNYVGTEHLLLGLLREQEGLAAQVLARLGLTLVEVREEVLNLLGHNFNRVASTPPAPGFWRKVGRWFGPR